jgi:hypothetical protein
VDAEPDRGRELLDARLEGVMPAHRPQHGPRQVGQLLSGHAGQCWEGVRVLSMVWLHTEIRASPFTTDSVRV